MRQRETNRWLKEEIVRKSNEGAIYSEGKSMSKHPSQYHQSCEHLRWNNF